MDHGLGQPSADPAPGKIPVLLDRVSVLSITYRLLRLFFHGPLPHSFVFIFYFLAHRRRLLDASYPFLPVYMLLPAHRYPLLEASSPLLCVHSVLYIHFLKPSSASSPLLRVPSVPHTHFLNTSLVSPPLLCVPDALQPHFLKHPTGFFPAHHLNPPS